MSRPSSHTLSFLAAAAAVALGCSPQPEGGGARFSLDVFASRALPPFSSLQIMLLTSGTTPSRSCSQILSPPPGTPHCLVAQGFTRADLVPLLDEQRRQHPAVIVTAPDLLDGGTGDVTITAQVGTKYTLVIEALSRDVVPQLVGTSCTPGVDIRDGDNGRLLADPIAQNPDTCDPRWEK